MSLIKKLASFSLLLFLLSCGGPIKISNLKVSQEIYMPIMLSLQSGMGISSISYQMAIIEHAINSDNWEFRSKILKCADLSSVLLPGLFFIESSKYDSVVAHIDSIYITFLSDSLVIGNLKMLSFPFSFLEDDFTRDDIAVVGDIYIVDGVCHAIGQSFEIEPGKMQFIIAPSPKGDIQEWEPKTTYRHIDSYSGFDWFTIKRLVKEYDLKKVDPVHSNFIGQVGTLLIDSTVSLHDAIFISSFIDTTYFEKYNLKATAFFTVKTVELGIIRVKQFPLTLIFDENMKLISADKKMSNLLYRN